MDNFEVLDNYFSVLEQTGYVSKSDMFKIIAYLFLTDLLQQPYPIMNIGQYDCLKYAKEIIAQNTCLIPNNICCNEMCT